MASLYTGEFSHDRNFRQRYWRHWKFDSQICREYLRTDCFPQQRLASGYPWKINKNYLKLGPNEKKIRKHCETFYSLANWRISIFFPYPNSSVMKHQVFSDLHKFLVRLTEATYNPMGLTILYIPREGLDEENKRSGVMLEEFPSTIENKNCKTEDNEAEGLIERLERVARCWIRQIRETLNGIDHGTKSSPCKTIDDEILYWQHRCSFSFHTPLILQQKQFNKLSRFWKNHKNWEKIKLANILRLNV